MSAGPQGIAATCQRLNHRPVVRCAFLIDGVSHVRDWCMCDPDLSRLNDATEQIPEWLLMPAQSWDHPQDPVTYSGVVEPGHESEALAFLDPATEERGECG